MQKASSDGRSAKGWSERRFVKKSFGDLPQSVNVGLNGISSPQIYKKDTVLFVEDQRPSGVFVIRKGLVKLSVSSADGKSLMVGRAGPDDVLGLPTVISGKPNELTAEAITSVHCSFITRAAFLEFVEEHGVAALRAAEIVTDMYHAAFDQARYLGLSSTAAEKLVRLILDLPAAEPFNGGDSRAFSITHKEIAEMIGTSRETVTRLFARFKKDQLVKVHDSSLRILDRPRLEQLLTE
jgi:CRP/FNR family transcriptional regulator